MTNWYSIERIVEKFSFFTSVVSVFGYTSLVITAGPGTVPGG